MNRSHLDPASSVADTMAGLLSGEILNQYYPGGLHAAPGGSGKGAASGGAGSGGGGGSDVGGTQTKTCKPTRNPCCKPPADSTPGNQGSNVQATQTKTCKPTRNPCCSAAEELVDDTADVQATKAKTCKPTRNPCCKES